MISTPVGYAGKGGDMVASLADLLSEVHLNRAVGLTPPSVPREKDARVGLIYDEAMELHVGPESEPSHNPFEPL